MTLASLGWIPNGVDGTKATLQIMRDFVERGKRSQKVRAIALSLVSQIPQRDTLGEVSALRDFVFNRIRYVRDIRGVETIQTPDATLELAAGDCDDKSVLLSALLESLGHKTRFAAYGFIPDKYSHVLVEVENAGKWIPLETTVAEKAIGWEPPDYYQKMTYPDERSKTMRLGWIDETPQIQYRINPIDGSLEYREVWQTDNLGGLFSSVWKKVKGAVKAIPSVGRGFAKGGVMGGIGAALAATGRKDKSNTGRDTVVRYEEAAVVAPYPDQYVPTGTYPAGTLPPSGQSFMARNWPMFAVAGAGILAVVLLTRKRGR